MSNKNKPINKKSQASLKVTYVINKSYDDKNYKKNKFLNMITK